MSPDYPNAECWIVKEVNGAFRFEGEPTINDATEKAMEKAGYSTEGDPCAIYAAGLPLCSQKEIRAALRKAAKSRG